MSRLPCDPHPRTTKKPSASASASVSVPASAAARLLLRRGGRAVATDESIEFFSALRECQPDPPVSGQTARGPADGRGKVRWRSNISGDGELLSTEIGKHDYDWLLTPPPTPVWPSATSGATGSTAVLNRLARATSASYAKSNSPLSLTLWETGNPTSRLAKSSSASATHSSLNAPAISSSGRVSHHVRTLSSALSSSIYAASNSSWSSRPSGSAATSPRTPATARSAAPTAWSRASARDKDHARQVSGAAAGTQRKASSSSSGHSALPTSTRPRAPTTGASMPKSTTVTSQQLALIRRGAKAVARSRFASQSTAGSMVRPASPTPHGGVRPSCIKPRIVPAVTKQCHGMAEVSTGIQRRRPSPTPSPAPLSASRGDMSAKRSSRNGDGGGRNINVEKDPPRRTADLTSAAVSSGLTRSGSRKPASNDTRTKRTANEDASRHGGAPAHLKPTVHQRSILRSMASRSRLGFMTGTSADAGSVARGRSTSAKGKLAAAAAPRVAVPDEFPSTRYDAMLLREDPRNLTWLNGCGVDDDEDGSCGAGLVEGSLEPFDVPAGKSGTAVRV